MPRPAGRGGEVRRDGKIVATEVAMQIGKVLGALGLWVLGTCFVVLLLQLRRSHTTATLTTT